MASLFEKFFTRSDAPKIKNEPGILPDNYYNKLPYLPAQKVNEIERYLHIF